MAVQASKQGAWRELGEGGLCEKGRVRRKLETVTTSCRRVGNVLLHTLGIHKM